MNAEQTPVGMNIAACVLTGLLFFGLWQCTRSDDRRSERRSSNQPVAATYDRPASDRGNETEARAMARILITKQMKVPSSTKFFELKARKVQGREYLVTGFVESQNSFGAAIRQRFIAAMEKTDRESWVLQSLALE